MDSNNKLAKTSKVNDVVVFGKYPWSLVCDVKLIEKLKLLPFDQYGVGIFEDERYLIDGGKFYKFADLEWIVLQKKPNGIFKLISKNIIDRCPRFAKSKREHILDSKLYSNFLNAVFPNRAFDEKERDKLQIIVHPRQDGGDWDGAERYLIADYPTLSIAKKVSNIPMMFSDYVKRYFDEVPIYYHLYKTRFLGLMNGFVYEAFNIEEEKMFLESNLDYPLGFRPVIEVKVDK